MVHFKFADVAEGLEEGKVLEVFVKEGDKVSDGQNLFSVETDKVTTEIPSSADGIITKIYIKPGQEIKVGEVVLEIDDGKGAAAPAPAASTTPAPAASTTPAAGSEIFHFKFADVAEGLEEGKVLEVFVKEGDKVSDGQNLFSVETDKVNTEIPSSVDGIVAKVFIKPGQEIKVGEVVVDIATGNAPAATAAPAEEETASVVGSVEVSNKVIAARALPKTNTTNADEVARDFRTTPLARRVAKELKVDINKVKGTGPHGRVLRADVEAAAQNVTATNAASTSVAPKGVALPQISVTGTVERVPMSGVRKAIAKQMSLSKTIIPETTLIKHVNVTKLMALRSQLKDQAAKYNVKLTFMPFFIKACAIALQEFPMLNASLDEQTMEIIYKKYYNIGMAVDSETGLMVPVIKTADQLSILQIASLVNDLAGKVRDRKISPSEMKDGTFTISNFGSAGIEFATPVINYPEVAILGVGTIEKKPVVNADGTIGVGSILPLSLSIDHRLIDGADGGRFLMCLAELLENPVNIML